MKIRPMKEVNMKRLFRRNQIIITTLAVMIAAAGYLNYAGKQELAGEAGAYEAGIMDSAGDELWAENQAALDGGLYEIDSLDQDLAELSEEPVQEAEMAAASELSGEALAENETQAAPETSGEQMTQAALDNPGEAVLTSGMSVADYIANVQLNREQIRAKNRDTLMSLINSSSIDEISKEKAIQDMIRLTEISEKENAAETLLMAKGFANPVVSIAEEKVDVVIHAASITEPQRAQIEDIVKRKAEVGADQIIITLMNLE